MCRQNAGRQRKYITVRGCRGEQLKKHRCEDPDRPLFSRNLRSGSGKSTLVYDTLYKGMMQKLYGSRETGRVHKEIVFDSEIDKVIVIDHEPDRPHAASNPATYTKVFDEIRTVFAGTKEAKMRGLQGRPFRSISKAAAARPAKATG